jgi:hypothetical protein
MLSRIRCFAIASSAFLLPCYVSSLAQAANPNPVSCSTTYTLAFCSSLNNLYNAAQASNAKPDDQSLKDTMNSAVSNVVAITDPKPFLTALTPNVQDALTALAKSQASSFTNAAQAFEQTRLDRDGGVSSSSQASTDLVSRAGVTEFISAALGVGAATETVAGNTGTLHINAGGLFSYLNNGSPIPIPKSTDVSKTKARSVFDLHKLDVAVSFDLNSPSSSTVPVTGAATPTTPVLANVLLPSSGSRWSGVTARYAIASPFDPGDKKFQNAWKTAFADKKDALSAAAEAASKAIENQDFSLSSAADKALVNKYGDILLADAKASKPADLAAHFDEYFKKLLALLASEHTDLQQAAAAAHVAVNTFDQINQDAIDEMNDQVGYPLLIEYDYNRPLNQPATHVARFVFSKKSNMALYTINATTTLYDGPIPAGSAYGRVRDGQVSAQFDRGFGTNSPFLVSGAVYYQYQPDPTVLVITSANLAPGTNITLPSDAKVLLGTAGNTVIGQVKATINLKSGLKIPFAFKWANRTNLIDSQDKVGQFGITYDFSSFSSLLTSKTTSTAP